MSPLTRRSALLTGAAASFTGLISNTAPAEAHGDPRSTAGRRTPLYCSPTNSRAGSRIKVPEPGPALFPMYFDSPDELAAYTRYDHLAQTTTPLLLGHRAGYLPDGPWPESALESAQNIVASTPATMVEIDLRMTKDGKCISMHDATMDRESTGTGTLADLDSSYVLSQNLVNNLGQRTQLKVREVKDFFAWGVPAGAMLWLDVKDATPEFTIDLIRHYEAESQVIVSAYGLANLAKFMQLAPDLVYFVPKIPNLQLSTIAEIKQYGDINRIIGFADYYIPDLQDSLTMHAWNAPMQLELNRYDQDLPAANLDARLYQRAVAAGFRVLCTNQYQKVAHDILGITAWPAKP